MDRTTGDELRADTGAAGGKAASGTRLPGRGSSRFAAVGRARRDLRFGGADTSVYFGRPERGRCRRTGHRLSAASPSPREGPSRSTFPCRLGTRARIARASRRPGTGLGRPRRPADSSARRRWATPTRAQRAATWPPINTSTDTRRMPSPPGYAGHASHPSLTDDERQRARLVLSKMQGKRSPDFRGDGGARSVYSPDVNVDVDITVFTGPVSPIGRRRSELGQDPDRDARRSAWRPMVSLDRAAR